MRKGTIRNMGKVARELKAARKAKTEQSAAAAKAVPDVGKVKTEIYLLQQEIAEKVTKLGVDARAGRWDAMGSLNHIRHQLAVLCGKEG